MRQNAKKSSVRKFQNIHEAKTHLSKLVDLAAQGQEIVICKAGNPVARIVRYETLTSPRTPDVWAGKVKIRPDFDELPDEFTKHFK